MEEKVFEIIAEHFDVDKAELSVSTNILTDMHADSLDLVELIMAFEDAFSISIPDDVALGVKTIGDVVNYLKNAK